MLQSAHLPNADLSERSTFQGAGCLQVQHLDVGMLAGLDAQAGRAFAAGRLVTGAVERPRHVARQRHLADMGRPDKQPGMREPAAFQAAPEQRHRLLLPHYRPHRLLDRLGGLAIPERVVRRRERFDLSVPGRE